MKALLLTLVLIGSSTQVFAAKLGFMTSGGHTNINDTYEVISVQTALQGNNISSEREVILILTDAKQRSCSIDTKAFPADLANLALHIKDKNVLVVCKTTDKEFPKDSSSQIATSVWLSL